MYDFSAIVHYVEYLRTQRGLLVSLHPMPEKSQPAICEKLRVFNFHENHYCVFIKRNAQAYQHCRACQKKVVKRCEGGTFYGVCFAGVTERVYPITSKTEVIGFISVSGYQTDQAESYINRISQTYGMDRGELKKRYDLLNPVFPDAKQLDTLLLPLCQMLELACLKCDTPVADETFTDKVIQFIKQTYNQHITSEDICRRFSCSRSFMSTQFNKATGKSIREYINELRITDAKRLLKESALSVTEIAFLLGFENSNYFSAIFKKQLGVSPLKYRKGAASGGKST